MNIGSILATVTNVVRNNSGILFVDSFQVQRATVTQSGSGDRSTAFQAVMGNPDSIPCTISPYKGSREQLKGEAMRNVTFVTIIAPAQIDGVWVDIKAADIIVVNERGLEPARTYQIETIGRESGVILEIIGSIQN